MRQQHLTLLQRYFNPHTYARCDLFKIGDDAMQFISIHTPTRGVTPLEGRGEFRVSFQSTHLREV